MQPSSYSCTTELSKTVFCREYCQVLWLSIILLENGIMCGYPCLYLREVEDKFQNTFKKLIKVRRNCLYLGRQTHYKISKSSEPSECRGRIFTSFIFAMSNHRLFFRTTKDVHIRVTGFTLISTFLPLLFFRTDDTSFLWFFFLVSQW